MDELEPLKPYIKEIYNNLGKPVADRLFKVLKRYGPGLIKYPVRMIERKDAEAAAKSEVRINEIERKDVEAAKYSEARIKLMENVTQHLTDSTELDPDTVRLLLADGFGWTIDKAYNFKNIVEATTVNMLDNPPDDVNTEQSTGDVSEDWLNQFREVACNKSSEDAQELFSKVLEGEIRKPGSFSLKALTTLADMDQHVAMLFKTFCSLCLVNLDNSRLYHTTQYKSHFKIKDARAPLIRGGTPGVDTVIENSSNLKNLALKYKTLYGAYCFDYSCFQLLIEYGLIVDGTPIEYNHFWYDNELWGFLLTNSNRPNSSDDFQSVYISGYALTSVGIELYHILDFDTPPGHWGKLSNILHEHHNVNLYKIPKPRKKSSPNKSE